MEVDKIIYNYYKSEVDKVITPPCVLPGKIYKTTRDRIYNIVFVTAIVLATIPLVTGFRTPSTLAGRSTEFYVHHNLDTIIPAGLVEINKFVSESLISGGNR